MSIAKWIAAIKATANAIAPGIPATLEAANALLDLVQSVAPTLAQDDQRALQAVLPALIAKMNADVDRAVSDLTG